MLIKPFYILLTTMILTASSNMQINAQVSNEEFSELKGKVELLESQNFSLRNEINNQNNKLQAEVRSYAPSALVLFLFGAFCALWAQNTGRSAWTWFVLGFIFSVLTVIALLISNSNDIKNN